MLRWLILLFFFFYSFGLLCQVRVSKTYPTPPKSVPLGIFNFSAHHFYVTRYNRLAHDITIERRRKSDGGMAAFTPLKLDSVNAPWFNYEELDHLFFEKNGTLYFVFERVLNSKSNIFMKVIDTLGKSSGFIQLAELAAERNEDYVSLGFALTGDKCLKLTKSKALGPNVYKQVEVIDPATRKTVFATKLPLENVGTGYSHEVTFDEKWNMYFVLFHYHFELDVAYNPFTGQLFNSRASVDSMHLATVDREDGVLRKARLPAQGLLYAHSVMAEGDPAGAKVRYMYSGSDSAGNEQIRFVYLRFDRELRQKAITERPLQKDLAASLTFFDGTEFDGPARKNYSRESCLKTGGCTYQFAERRENNYHKELLVWRTNDSDNTIDMQAIIPRKIFFFGERAYFKHIGTAMHAVDRQSIYTLVLEHRTNGPVKADEFDFHNFRRQEAVEQGNLVAYILRPAGQLEKTLVFQNKDYSCVPLNYEGTMPDMVLYLSKGDMERFAVLALNQL